MNKSIKAGNYCLKDSGRLALRFLNTLNSLKSGENI
jgi:hypothetical protein